MWVVAAEVEVTPKIASIADYRGPFKATEGQRVDALEVYCKGCRWPYDEVKGEDCVAKIDNRHLIGGDQSKHAKRKKPTPPPNARILYSPKAALSHPVFTGLQHRRLGALIGELADAWTVSEEGRLHDRRGHDRMRAVGAGPRHQLVFTDRVIAALVILRFQLPYAALAVLYGVNRCTITRAVHEIRPLLAARGFAVPGRPDVRLRTLADVFAYAAAEGVELRLDGTEVRVRRPRASKPGRRAFVSGKMRQNTTKTTVVTDEKDRTLWAGAFRPGRMHDQTAVKTEGICDLFERYPQVKAKVDAGYRGLAKRFPNQVQAPPLKPKKDAPAEDVAAWEAARHQQSSERICVEHANAEHKQWRPLQRYIERREYFAETYSAVAGLASDRAAER